MALDLTGIQNENEFYTTYYLQEVLETDLEGAFDDWAAHAVDGAPALVGARPPHEVLGGVSGPFFQKRNQLVDRQQRDRRLELQREIERAVVEALGYDWAPMLKQLQGGDWMPVLAQVDRPDGTPVLCVVEAPPAEETEDADPLEQTLTADQFEGLLPEYAGPNVARAQFDIEQHRPLDTPIAELVTTGLFALDEPPRWVIVVSDAQVVLLDRNKWPQKRLLRFELDEILSRKDAATLKATAALLHRRSTCPDEGFSLLDTFDENAHKHAFAVSEDLKYALRASIELIGNEAIRYIQQERKEKTYDGALDADQLTTECLRYMYRLLFLFYIEARPELGYAPMDSDEYVKGYSVEHLRDLELVELTSEEAKNGYYIHHSLQRLFSLVYDGFPKVEGAMRTDGAQHLGSTTRTTRRSTTPSPSSRCARTCSTRSGRRSWARSSFRTRCCRRLSGSCRFPIRTVGGGASASATPRSALTSWAPSTRRCSRTRASSRRRVRTTTPNYPPPCSRSMRASHGRRSDIFCPYVSGRRGPQSWCTVNPHTGKR